MKRSLLLLALAVLAVGAGSMAQDAEPTGDGQHRVAYAIDPITGEYLFVGDMNPFLFDLSEAVPPEPSAPSGNLIQMHQIAVIPTPTRWILSAPQGLDLDHDGQREFIIRKQASNGLLEFYESIADDTFVLVHVLDLENSPLDAYVPADAGDIDDDGLADLVVFAQDHLGGANADYGTRVYESESTDTYPTELVWEVVNRFDAWSSHGLIADTDADGKQEIVVKEPAQGGKLVIYENDGDNSYVQIYSVEPTPGSEQSMDILSDLDNDGRDEILKGGLGNMYALESIGDNTYEFVWSWDFDPFINVEFSIDAGDLDGDGKKEFLVGGLKPNSPLQLVAHVFEVVSDNNFEIVATFVNPYGDLESQSIGAVADVDGDGFGEIVLGSGTTLRIYKKNAGGFGWTEIWTQGLGNLFALGTGDHDADGKEEIIVGEILSGLTTIWEIDPADAADMDGDDVVDVIDNCPLIGNPGQEDADSDSVGDVCDNCIYGPNPTQGPAIFGQDVVAEDRETFSWRVAADVVYVKGNLADVSSYTVDLVDSAALTVELTDSSIPASGAGFYYLFRPDCGVGSWQTSLGAEPERDLVLP